MMHGQKNIKIYSLVMHIISWMDGKTVVIAA